MRCKLLIVLLMSGSAYAQQPTPNCSQVELRASMAESRVAAERLRVETCGARNDALERELGKQKNQLGETEARLSDAKQRVADLEKTLMAITRERDAALQKIKRANGRWICEIFRLGCVK